MCAYMAIGVQKMLIQYIRIVLQVCIHRQLADDAGATLHAPMYSALAGDLLFADHAHKMCLLACRSTLDLTSIGLTAQT